MKTLDSLVVRVDEFPPDGLDIVLDLSPADVAALVAEEGEAVPVILSPLTGCLSLKIRGRRLMVKGSFQVEAQLTCDRCLAEGPGLLESEVDETLTLGSSAPASSEGEEDDDLSLEIIDGKVNLSGLVVEYFWLAWPWHHLCKTDCAGLCPRCGADLNEGLCSCAEGCGHS